MDYQAIGRYIDDQLKNRKGFYEVDTSTFWGLDPARNFTTRTADLKVGQRSLEFLNRIGYGTANIYDGKATDIPIVDYSMGAGNVPALLLIDGARWNIFDLETEQTANESGIGTRHNLIQTSLELMGEFLNRRENELMLFGDEDRNVYGILNQPITPVDYAVSNLYDAAVTPIQIYNLFIGWIQQFVTQAKISTSRQIQIKIPERLMAKMSAPYSDATPSITLYEMLTNQSKGYAVASIDSAIELEGQHLTANNVTIPANRDRIIFKTTGTVMECSFFPRKTTPVAIMSATQREIVSYSGISSVYTPRSNRLMYVDIKNA